MSEDKKTPPFADERTFFIFAKNGYFFPCTCGYNESETYIAACKMIKSWPKKKRQLMGLGTINIIGGMTNYQIMEEVRATCPAFRIHEVKISLDECEG